MHQLQAETDFEVEKVRNGLLLILWGILNSILVIFEKSTEILGKKLADLLQFKYIVALVSDSAAGRGIFDD